LAWTYDGGVNQGITAVRIKGMGKFGVSILCAAAVSLAAACSGSGASAPLATVAPTSPTAAESPAERLTAVLSVMPALDPTLAPAVVEPDLPPTTTQVPPAQPAPVQLAVATAVIPARSPPTEVPTAVPEPPARPAPITISMTLNLADRSFSPHQVHGNSGDTVALTFIGGTEQHTFTVSSLNIDVTIGARETMQFSFVMPVDGEVPFFCRLHGTPSSGMHGLLIFH